jgi:hypothetical protein
MSRTLKRLLLSIGTGSAGARFLLIYLFADPRVHACTMYVQKQRSHLQELGPHAGWPKYTSVTYSGIPASPEVCILSVRLVESYSCSPNLKNDTTSQLEASESRGVLARFTEHSHKAPYRPGPSVYQRY